MPEQAFFAAVEATLLEPDPLRKCSLLAALALGHEAQPSGHKRQVMEGLLLPGRPARPQLVHPRELPKRGLQSAQGRAALVHAITHIEFNAINLALDALWRFRGMPADYYRDWLGVAADEARHFGWLQQRLQALGHSYGDFPAHNGLWEAACKTAHDPLVRMALVPRVLEARGLDVTPGMILRLREQGDTATVALLERILEEEVAHVAIGSRWFRFLCTERDLEPDEQFKQLVNCHLRPLPKGRLNQAARLRSGFSQGELEFLRRAADPLPA